MRRRDFIAGIAGSSVVWPLAAHAQQPAMPVIGVLNALSPSVAVLQQSGFKQGLNEAGYIEDRNVKIEFRWPEGHYTGCLHSRLIWWTVASPSSRLVDHLPRGPQRPRHQRSLLFSLVGMTPFRSG